MRLDRLIQKLEVRRVEGPVDRDVRFLCHDSRRAGEEGLFVALRGSHRDGHQFLEAAIEAGAPAVVVSEPFTSPKATVIEVEDTRYALARLGAVLYGAPSRFLKMAGVTGTNGKTTTAFLIKHLCDAALMRCGLIGTVRYEVGERILPATHTTPECSDIQDLLAQMRSAGCKAAAMEVSSHALDQGRVDGIDFDAVVFTNLTQDHLDYHGTMDRYFESKAKLFAPDNGRGAKTRVAVVNADDRYGHQLIERASRVMKVVAYGMGMRSDYRFADPVQTFTGTTFQLKTPTRSFLVRTPLIGRFNVYNATAAVAAAEVMGVDPRAAVAALANAPQVPGRLQLLPVKRSFHVYVDYAHTPDALQNAIATVRELHPARLITVFGCGGNRDRGKRMLMGEVADGHSDHTILTSDNPRDEDPLAIIEDIRRGFRSSSHSVIPERREAIFSAIAMAGPRDIILIAGKGHETYQETAGQRVPFDDVQVATEALQQRGGG